MEPIRLCDPEKELRDRIALEEKRIYACDPVLAAAIDVSPPPVDPMSDAMQPVILAASAEPRGLAYRAARRLYRRLKHVKLLRPVLEAVRDAVRRLC